VAARKQSQVAVPNDESSKKLRDSLTLEYQRIDIIDGQNARSVSLVLLANRGSAFEIRVKLPRQ